LLNTQYRNLNLSYKTSSIIGCSSRTLHLHYVFSVWNSKGSLPWAGDHRGVEFTQLPTE